MLRLPASEGGLLNRGRSSPSIDKTAGERGIFGGLGGDTCADLGTAGQKLGDGITNEGYLLDFSVVGGDWWGEFESMLVGSVMMEGANSESSSESSYRLSKSPERLL